MPNTSTDHRVKTGINSLERNIKIKEIKSEYNINESSHF